MASPEQDPLAGIDEFDWSSVSHAYGSATDVPEDLRGLASDDEEDFDQALLNLYGSIFHQGSRYSASPVAVPYIVKLVLRPTSVNRHSLVLLLTRLALGYEPPHGFNPQVLRQEMEDVRENGVATIIADYDARIAAAASRNNEFQVAMLQAQKETNVQENYLYETRFNNVMAYDAVWAQIPVLMPLLGDSDEEVRFWAAHMFAWFPEEKETLMPALKKLIDLDAEHRHPTITATAMIAIALLCRFDVAQVAPYIPIFQANLPSAEPWIKWASAVSLKLSKHDDSISAAVDVLAKSLGAPPKAEDEDEDIDCTPYCDSMFTTFTIGLITLDGIPSGLEGHVQSGILDALEVSKGMEFVEAVTIVLPMLFSSRWGSTPADLPSFESLNSAQQRLVLILAQPDPFLWHLANFTGPLHQYGFPHTKSAMREYAQLPPDNSAEDNGWPFEQ